MLELLYHGFQVVDLRLDGWQLDFCAFGVDWGLVAAEASRERAKRVLFEAWDLSWAEKLGVGCTVCLLNLNRSQCLFNLSHVLGMHLHQDHFFELENLIGIGLLCD